ncbi:GTPase [Georgenia sp. M64]|uniref:GTPase n=1 Tax=Georgenia sp. M64 TaxID=3120520 RepID=UPI0030DEBBFD
MSTDVRDHDLIDRAEEQGDGQAPAAGTAPAHDAPADDAPGGRAGAADALTARVAAVRSALDAAQQHLDPRTVARARTDLDAAEARLAVGVDRTVVALVGGTGSGKSSLFNAISGLEFADVGALRPTTEVAAACVWGGDAEVLLDFLDVAPTRRIRRESVLDADRERALAGMVLLDLPDHDSVALGHARQVDRLLPLVDLLVWVVDPQKYADHLLHERYLRALVDRQESMLVLVNQADTIPADAVEKVRADVAALLAADGLDRVPVLATSALAHTGIAEVRRALAEAVARPSAAARTAGAELDAMAARLAPALGRAPEPDPEETARLAADLTRASGADAVAGAIRTALAAPRGGALARPEPPAAATVAAVRDRWTTRVGEGLPTRWRAAVDAAVPDVAALRSLTAEAAAGVPLPAGRSTRGTRALVLAGILALVGIALAVAAAGAGQILLGLGALAGLGAAGALVVRARGLREQDAAEEAERYVAESHRRAVEVVEDHLVRPTEEALEPHRALTRALGR